ncbi:hypothetical protein TIFTF001_033091 [Ficus carica]|uniref:Protein kinase domain-containing protein n=1 Tax=Ficus carica TaxID=3494 RepID=A0AA88DXU4_FICCA|nr:hypothetical protein TIFTF001_033091 [Ficus carica]
MVLILFYFTATTHELQLPYIPEDNITIDCGSSVVKNMASISQRSWNGDTKYFTLDGRNNDSVTLVADEPSMEEETVPYSTARLSHSVFTYAIPVTTPGPKFIRLYFYSSSYGNFDPSKAFFSVKLGKYTLLSNFSVSLTAGALDQKGIEKEYCVTVEQSSLNITFTPSSSIPDAFAFINGIEVVSMPSSLYYPGSVGRQALLVGQLRHMYTVEDTTALETMYRINIGGNAIPATDDTGMYRQWEMEDEYLTVPGLSVLPVSFDKLTFKDNITSYAAPAVVYTTARSTGNDKNITLLRSYNLTWEFPVDSGFSYMLRLHFCEIIPEFSRVGDRVFLIYIGTNLAESKFDVVWQCGGQYVPCFKDYVVLNLGEIGEKKVNLSVALQVKPEMSAFVDAILNGVEIFKMNDTTGNLAAPNPDPIRTTILPPTTQRSNDKSNRTSIVGVVSGVVCGIIILSVLGFYILRRGRKVKGLRSNDKSTWWGPFCFCTTKSSKIRCSSSLPSDLCRYFSLAEIKAATNNFEDIFIIGVGGFGNVYKGYIDGGTTTVAIKRLKSESSQGAHEFKTEIEMLSHLRHRHLVSLIGYCNEDHEMILVYDYMSRGTLQGHLYNTENPLLTWKQRLEICIGAARGLHYLHTGTKYAIIHRDIKTTNILLDEKWAAKVSDFGLSKMGPTTMSKAHVSTVVKGSIGYLDPEYYRRQHLSEKSDIYSFGVVLCEVLCGRPPIMRNAEKGQVSVAEWAQSSYCQGKFHQIVDPHLTGKIAPGSLKKYSEIAVNCLHDNGSERPSMNDVVWGLEFAMQLQQNAEDNDRIVGAIMEAKGEDEVAFVNTNNNNNVSDGTFSSWEHTSGLESSGMTKFSSSEQGSSTTNESIKISSGPVFSEINDPKPR